MAVINVGTFAYIPYKMDECPNLSEKLLKIGGFCLIPAGSIGFFFSFSFSFSNLILSSFGGAAALSH